MIVVCSIDLCLLINVNADLSDEEDHKSTESATNVFRYIWAISLVSLGLFCFLMILKLCLLCTMNKYQETEVLQLNQ